MRSHPPALVQWLLSSVLPARTRDSVLGDLIEEYRESQLPRSGSLRADWWYLRQAAGFIWRSSRLWALSVAVLLGGRATLDATVPTTDDFHVRALVTTYAAFTLFIGLGILTGWRTRKMLGAALTAVTAAVIGGMLALIGPVAIGALVSAGWLHVISPRGLREAFDLPIVPMAIVGAIVASCGALVGKTVSTLSAPRIGRA